MPELIEILQSIGETTLEMLWLPVLIWTIIAISITWILRSINSIPPVYQYHSRVALLLALPVGLAGSYLTGFIGNAAGNTETAAAKFIVVQSPLTATATSSASEPALSTALSDPVLWTGILNVILAMGALYLLSLLIINVVRLRSFGQHLTFRTVREIPELKNYLSAGQLDKYGNTLVAFSTVTHIPFTFGWLKTRIVLPSDMKKSHDRFAMAVQHELMHIKHRDYLLNGILLIIKSIFWFHPLVHYLHRSGQDFREITCDSEVLSENRFSKKKYAALLFELAQREKISNKFAMSMAVNPSTLKKRIQQMNEQRSPASRFRSSFFLTLMTAGVVILSMACTDIQEGGITNTEVEQVQADIYNKSDEDTKPLFVINGEIVEDDKYSRVMISRIKTKYIKYIQVYKDQDAIDRYGEAGKNGVVEIELIDRETAFSDLKPPPPPAPGTASSGTDSVDSNQAAPPPPEETFFVAVEEMPELEDGLASIQKEIRYPQEAREAGVEGRVIVQFIVNEQGEVENPEVIRGIGAGCDEEALRVVKQAKFKPGKQRGQPVRVQYSLPIIYRLQSENTGTQSSSAELEQMEVNESKMEIRDLEVSDDGTVNGYIYDREKNKPLPGVNVIVESTTIGTSTAQDGKFTLNNLQKGNQQLILSYIGYTGAKVPINVK